MSRSSNHLGSEHQPLTMDRLRGKTTAAAAAAGILAMVLAGCTVDADASNTPKGEETQQGQENTTVNNPESNPTPSSLEQRIEQMPDRYDFGLSEADVAVYLNESPEQFAQRPLSERADLALYYAQEMPDFVSDWVSVSKNPADIVPAEINESNTPEEIMAVILALRRMPLTVTGSDNFTLDKNMSDRLLIAGHVDGINATTYSYLSQYSGELSATGEAAPSARTLAVASFLPAPTIKNSSDKYVNAAGLTCTDIDVRNVDGSDSYATACLVKTQHGSIWMQANR